MHNAESARFYDQDGKVVDLIKTQVGAKNAWREPTVIDAKKNNWYPSWSTISKVLHSHRLESYKIEQALLAAASNPFAPDPALEHEDVERARDAWVAATFNASRNEARDAADEGTKIHGFLKEWFGGKALLDMAQCDKRLVDVAVFIEDWLKGKGLNVDVRSESTFVNARVGVAGTMDLRGKEFVLDYKCRDLSKKSSKTPYLTDGCQLSCYRNCGIKINGSQAMISVIVDRNLVAEPIIYEWSGPEAEVCDCMWWEMYFMWRLQCNWLPPFAQDKGWKWLLSSLTSHLLASDLPERPSTDGSRSENSGGTTPAQPAPVTSG